MLKQSSGQNTEALPEMQYNFLVLNSLSFFEKNREQMERFENIHLSLDRHKMGLKLIQEALQWSRKYMDKSKLYKNFKDINEKPVDSYKNEQRKSQRKGLRF